MHPAATMDQKKPLSNTSTPTDTAHSAGAPIGGAGSAGGTGGAGANHFPISELTRRTGTTKRVVEHAEAKGLLQPAARTQVGHKLYGAEQEGTLRLVVRLYELGFSANRIKSLFADPPQRIEQLFDEHRRFLEGRVEEARRRLETFERERSNVRADVEAHRQHEHSLSAGAAAGSNGNASTNQGLIAPQPERLPGRKVEEAA